MDYVSVPPATVALCSITSTGLAVPRGGQAFKVGWRWGWGVEGVRGGGPCVAGGGVCMYVCVWVCTLTTYLERCLKLQQNWLAQEDLAGLDAEPTYLR